MNNSNHPQQRENDPVSTYPIVSKPITPVPPTPLQPEQGKDMNAPESFTPASSTSTDTPPSTSVHTSRFPLTPAPETGPDQHADIGLTSPDRTDPTDPTVQPSPVQSGTEWARSGPTPPSAATFQTQPPVTTEVRVTGDFEAERGRFELPRRFKPPTAFPVLLLRPLGHLSGLFPQTLRLTAGPRS